jgi:hypothetical protein
MNDSFYKKWRSEQKYLARLCSNLAKDGHQNKKLEDKLNLINNKLEEE